MPTVFQRQIDSASRLIAKNGRMITLNRPGVTDIDPVTQEITATPASEQMTAVILPVSSTRRAMNDAAIKDLQNSSVKKLLIAAKGLTLTPVASDTFDLGSNGGADWKVYGIDTVAPDGTDILHSITIFK